MTQSEIILRVADLLNTGEVFGPSGLRFQQLERLFIGGGEFPTLGLHYDAPGDRLVVAPFGHEQGNYLWIPFQFDLDPPLSKAREVAADHMMTLAAMLLSPGDAPKFRSRAEVFASRWAS